MSSRSSFSRRVPLGIALAGALILLVVEHCLAASSITLAWDPSPSADVASYRVYYGFSSRDYSSYRDAGNNTQLTLQGLETGRTYYFTVSAIGTDQQESSYANEVVHSFIAGNTPPTMSPIQPVATKISEDSAAVAFTVGDAETPAADLTISKTSNNTQLVPAGNIWVWGSGANRYVRIHPVANQTGTALVTLTVSDGLLSSSQTFTVTVQNGNTPPTISPIPDQSLTANEQSQAIAFTVGDAQTTAGNLTVSKSSSNTGLIPTANIWVWGTGATRYVRISPAASQTGSALITLQVSDGSLTASRSFTVTVQKANTPPTITPIANVTIKQNEDSQALGFTVGDAETPVSNLTISKSSSNTGLIPSGNIWVWGDGASKYVRVRPATDKTGTALITLTVSDGSLTASRSFTVTVSDGNSAPTISAIPNITVNEDATSDQVAFTIGDAETPVTSLTLSKASSNTKLVPTGNIWLGGSGANRTVQVKPADNQNGSAQITLTVSDGKASRSRTFTVTVRSVNDLPVLTLSSAVPVNNGGSSSMLLLATPTRWIELAPEGETLTPDSLAPVVILEDGSWGPTPVSVSDVETPVGDLHLTASATDGTLIPQSALSLAGTGSSRNLTIRPSSNRSGSARIDVRLSDGQATVSKSFGLVVKPVNDPPTLDPIPSVGVTPNSGLQTVVLEGITPGPNEAGQKLKIMATSSNPGFVPQPVVVYSGSGSRAAVQFVPQGQSGFAVVTVTVRDDGGTADGGSDTITRTFPISVKSGTVAASSVAAAGTVASRPEASTLAPPPVLRIARQGASVLVFWESARDEFILEASPTLGDNAVWSAVGGTVQEVDGLQVVTMTPEAPIQFFRLKHR